MCPLSVCPSETGESPSTLHSFPGLGAMAIPSLALPTLMTPVLALETQERMPSYADL